MKQNPEQLTRMILFCEEEARAPIANLVAYPQNTINTAELQRAANFSILAEEYRRQLTDAITQ